MNNPSLSGAPVRRQMATKNDDEIDVPGGEPLEGSGFEAESPEPDFQFDWPSHTTTIRSTGGGQ